MSGEANAYPDLATVVKTQDNDLGDCIVDGLRIDVKTTTLSYGKLLCAKWKNDAVDLYALMTGHFPTYEFRGVASADRLKREENLTKMSRGQVYALEQSALVYDEFLAKYLRL